MSMEKITAGTNKSSPDGLSHPNQKNNNNKENMVIFYKKLEKYNEFQLTKKMVLNNRKMTNHPPSPVKFAIIGDS